LAVFSFLASFSPDGLERVAEDKNFIRIERSVSLIKSPIPEYLFPGISHKKIAGSIAGIAGVLLVFGLGIGLSSLLRKRI